MDYSRPVSYTHLDVYKRQVGASERGIQSYEIGERNPAFDQLIALADYFDVSIDYLVGRTDKPAVNK